jgi:phosphoglycolate phosphatase-like HAD superfamily hydrolase
VARKKPHPDGLVKILAGRSPETALYVGDNVDDALAARSAGMRFMAILPAGVYGYRARAAKFRELGSLALLPRATAIAPWLE